MLLLYKVDPTFESICLVEANLKTKKKYCCHEDKIDDPDTRANLDHDSKAVDHRESVFPSQVNLHTCFFWIFLLLIISLLNSRLKSEIICCDVVATSITL